jgi:Fe-S oxidoreductase
VDIFSVLIILSVVFFLLRRFIFRDKKLSILDPVLLSDTAKKGISRDSAIVAFFIFFHVGFRFLGASFEIAAKGYDSAQPAAALISGLWSSLDKNTLDIWLHLSWWGAFGLILAFLPYFPYSKHAHLFMGPFNHTFRKELTPSATLIPLNLEDEKIEQFGAALLEHLPQKSILDAYACIMCNRCQDGCPAYRTSKPLSPSALEVNKRYQLNIMENFFKGEASEKPLREWLIQDDGIWACTTCGYCSEVCPVGNEPLKDLLHIRQDLVLMQSVIPQEGVNAFKNLENNGNPWGLSQEAREKWTEGLEVPRVRDNSDMEYLFWVGCAGAYDDKAMKTSKAMVQILNRAGVKYAILGNEEKCTGDSARRMGNEYLFQMAAKENIQTFEKYKIKKIITQCPHCLYTIKQDYSAFGGNFEVFSHTDFILKLLEDKKIALNQSDLGKISYHDSCYLGRYNGIYNSPRKLLQKMYGEANFQELARNHNNSFCCGAGGGWMWLDEKIGGRINAERTADIKHADLDAVGVACPFCNTMLTDGCNSLELKTKVSDLAVLVSENLR